MREVLDGLELLSRVLAARGKHLAHAAWILTNGLGDTIDGAEFRWDVAVLSVDLDNEERLLHVGDLQLVVLQEVLSNAHLLAIVSLKPSVDRVLVKVDIFDKVGLLVAVSADDSLVLELAHDLHGLVPTVRNLEDLVDSLEARLVRDELVDAVDHNGQA